MDHWAQRRTTDGAHDNVAEWGSRAIIELTSADENSKARWRAADAERVLRDIAAETSGASGGARRKAQDALGQLQ